MKPSSFSVSIVLFAAVLSPRAGAATAGGFRYSADYSSSIESGSAGGGRQASANYTAYNGIGEISGMHASGAVIVRNGFIGQFTLAPGSVLLSNDSILEKEPAGTVIGRFSPLDPELGETYGYQLVSGAGDDNNSSFFIEGDALKTQQAFNFRTRRIYGIRTRSTDSSGLFVERAFTIQIENVEETPLARDVSIERAPGSGARLSIQKLLNAAFEPDGDLLTLVDFENSSEQGGTVIEDGGWLIYAPPDIDPEVDAFGFTLSDGRGGTAQARVRIRVRALDEQPTHNVTRVILEDQDVIVRFAGIPGQIYHIDYTMSLATVAWIELGTVLAGPNGRFEFRDLAPGESARFYRAVVR